MSGYVDPVVAAIQELRRVTQQLEQQAAQAPPPPPPEPPAINLTITMPPMDVHVANDVKPTPVHVTNDVRPAPAQTATPPTVRVTVPPTDGPKQVTFVRDNDGRITSAKVTDGG